jgi:hypothetical protein
MGGGASSPCHTLTNRTFLKSFDNPSDAESGFADQRTSWERKEYVSLAEKTGICTA